MLHIIVAVVGLIIGYVCGSWIDNFINRKQKRNLNKINVVSIPAYIKATCPHCDANIEKNFLDFVMNIQQIKAHITLLLVQIAGISYNSVNEMLMI